MTSFYPKQISQRTRERRQDHTRAAATAFGSAAALECGTHVRFEIVVSEDGRSISDATPQTNGCGYMTAAAAVLGEQVKGSLITDLHGLGHLVLADIVEQKLCKFPADRRHCLTTAIAALKAVFIDLRRRRVEEFTGEKALICTCFSVTEETIEELIVNGRQTTVRAIGEACNAGTGCGSCQPMIQELLDAHRFEMD